jgi:lipopolysaccharide transport system permease protein
LTLSWNIDRKRKGNDAPPSKPSAADEKPVLVLKPSKGWVGLKLAELWEYRELTWYLAWREISARYKQTAVGILWAVLQPLLAMLVFTVVFGRLAKIPSDGLHYPVFCYAAMLPWSYFSSAMLNSSNSIIKNVHLITKVHFPRLIIPISGVISPLVDFAAGCFVLIILMLQFHMEVSPRIIYLPIFILLAMVTALGAGLWLAALSVEYRDIHHVLPFVMQLWMFASPVVYSSSLVPQDLRWVLGVNPMAGVISAFRWAILGTQIAPGWPMFRISVAVAIVMLITGAYYFRRMERTFADVV